MKRKISIILLAVMLAAALSSTAFADTGIGVEPGQAMPDFTVSLTDGTSATLSEILKEKDLVVLNVFASWCGPCEREFPEMENVYQAKKDRMEIISVSGYSDDTMDLIADYKSGHGLSFPMGLTGDGLSFLKVTAYPTTIFIDRDSKVGFVKIGAFTSREDFEKKVSVFLSSDYDGKPLASEKAFNPTPYLLGWMLIGSVIQVIGRWGILRKAGKKGWHSLIPFLNTYQEYSTCWKGWPGLIMEVCKKLAGLASVISLPRAAYFVLIGAGLLISIPENLKLAKSFGKSKVFGALMVLPVFKEVGRLILGTGKAGYQGPQNG